MYPISFKFHGIRDFSPRVMELGGPNQHVLIGGKNGSGKSTLVYAMAFALASDRVSIDGLRSKLLKKDKDAWHAKIGILFHNPPGEGQCDAPEFVELIAEIKSMAGSTSRQVTYMINGGAVPDKLSLLRKFKTRTDVWDYYIQVLRFDADGHFMFWYQGSIVEFAKVKDSERFDKVAAMFKIDEIQKEWEIARADRKQAEGEFENARHAAQVQNRKLRNHEKNKNELELRDSQRADAIQRLLGYLLALVEVVQGEKLRLEVELEEYQKKYASLEFDCERLDRQLEKVNADKKDAQTKASIQEQDQRQKSLNFKEKLDLLDEWKLEKTDLEKQHADILERMKSVRKTQKELETDQIKCEFVLENLKNQLETNIQEEEISKNAHTELLKKIGGEETDEGRLKNEITELESKDKELPSYEELMSKQSTAELSRNKTFKEKEAAKDLKDNLKEELDRLNRQKTLLLPEQERILNIYKQAGIEAVTFGELFEIKAGVSRETSERIFNPLKHTVFVARMLEGVEIEQSFYIVSVGEWKKVWYSLSDTRPELLTHLNFVPELVQGLSTEFFEGIKQWLGHVLLDETQPTQEKGKLHLWQGSLWDAFGMRGPVKNQDAIGIRALEIARQKVALQHTEAINKFKLLSQELIKLEQLLAQLVRKIGEREGVNENLPVKRQALALVSLQLITSNEQEKALHDKLKLLGQDIGNLTRNRESQETMLTRVRADLAVYAELDAQAEAINRVQELQRGIDDLEPQVQRLKMNLETLSSRFEELKNRIPSLITEVATAKALLDSSENDLERRKKERDQCQETLDTLTLEAEELENRMGELTRDYDQVIAGLKFTSQWQEFEVSLREKGKENLKRKVMDAENDLNNTKNRVVDEEARVKYDEFLYEFQQANQEMTESELRFNNLKKKEEGNRVLFEKAVYTRWQRTNQLFSGYMGRLGLRGEIKSIPPEEDSKSPQYKWELHVATKEGHKLEKIHSTSSKIVGEGISGGEEAVTSLVFALALLSDITNKPPFYVLDEFDSALDEERKHQIFDLYNEILGRKLIIISPKVHGDQYLNRFGKFHCVVANPGVKPGYSVSEVYDVTREQYEEMPMED